MIRRSSFTFLFDQLLLQFRIVVAIAQREMLLKAGKGDMGLLGVFLEPIALVATLMVLRIFLRQSGTHEHMSPVLWLSLGFVPFFMFSDVAIRSISGVAKNSDLYFYRRIKPLDTLLGSAWMTTQIYGLLLLAVVLMTSILQWSPAIVEPGLAILCSLMIPLLGFGLGLTTLVLGHRLPIMAKLMKTLLRRIMIWTSCTFFSISMIPEPLRPFILWNPLAHGIELLRYYANPLYPIPGISATYFYVATIASLGLGFFVYSNNEDLLTSVD
ncbi:MAG: ABC transporter permease [Cyanobacteriota bacterium]|jgi:capsular polysaccharide transport system permease protein